MVGGAACHAHLGAEQLEEEGQLLELRLVSELGSGGVVQLAERSSSVCLAGDVARHGLAPFIGEESSSGVTQGQVMAWAAAARRQREQWQC